MQQRLFKFKYSYQNEKDHNQDKMIDIALLNNYYRRRWIVRLEGQIIVIVHRLLKIRSKLKRYSENNLYIDNSISLVW